MSSLKIKDYRILNRGEVHTPNSMGWDLWVEIEIEGQCDCGHTFNRPVEVPLRAKHIHMKCWMCKSNEWTIELKIV